ncbi:3-isopropylmalate dehydratase small subunit [Mesobacillus maritimus]|uniref:3-isopropylmalate dehydratase small subunit n=1 Tax=Mesobacillus maritimus TaxID=1643336 RepID=A0ABS7KAI8_9BACI|nr:3-isopropylmalate dehydratase small subunit [Mesobacillus maritimus]MBY0099091.1 3-isopropylmalate dehydratase small subunit [Mesobacillus maritimus]
MAGLTTFRGKVAGMDRVNVDTDQIIPKQFLKRTEKTGFGQYLFYDWRFQADGTPNPDFELNRPENNGAEILVANENFGCGSSREHAPWALLDYGIKIVIAPSFADIFHQNCLKNGMLPVVLKDEEVRYLIEKAKDENYELTVSLKDKTVKDSEGFQAEFPISDYWQTMLVNGWDEIELTLQLDERILAYEESLI